MCSAYLNSAKCKYAVAFVSVCVFVCAVTNKPFNHAFRGRAHAIKSCGQDIIVQSKENHQPCIAIHLKSLGFQGTQTCSAKMGYWATVVVRSPSRRDLEIRESLHFSPSWSVCADVVNAWLRNASSISAPRDASQAQCWSAGHPRIHEQINKNYLNLSFQGAIQLHIVPNRKRLLKPKLTVFKTKLIQEANKHTYTNGKMSARN